VNAIVKDVMSTHVVAVRQNATFKEMAARLHEQRVSAFPVLDDDNKVIGIVSEADLLTKEALEGELPSVFHTVTRHRETVKAAALTAAALMTRPAVTIGPDEPVTHAARLMYSRRVKRLPVTAEDGTLIGIVSRADVLSVYDRPDADIRHEITQGLILETYLCDPGHFTVTVKDGIVTIEGAPETTAVGRDIIESARHVEGVVAVRDRLTYPPTAHHTPTRCSEPVGAPRAPTVRLTARLEDEGDQHLGGVLVGAVGVLELLRQVRLFADGAVDEEPAEHGGHDQAVQARGERGADQRDDQARVDRVPDQAVRAGGHQFRLVLVRHRRAPVAADVQPCPHGERQAEQEERQPYARQHRIGPGLMPPKAPGAHRDNHHDEERDPQPDETVPPAGPTGLHSAGRDEPVGPEDDPPNHDDEVDDAHTSIMYLHHGRFRRLAGRPQPQHPAAAGCLLPGSGPGAIRQDARRDLGAESYAFLAVITDFAYFSAPKSMQSHVVRRHRSVSGLRRPQ